MHLGQLECSIDLSLVDEISSLLEEMALSVAWYEKKPDQWALQVICESSRELILREKIKIFFRDRALPVPEITACSLPQKDWVSAVYANFPPLTIGKFYIHGSHIQKISPPGLIPLQIDAATAFGSGQHESTEGCLQALSLLASQQTFKAPLDMGCGSGILALAMAALWKVPVLASDNDPEAVHVTNENARANHLEDLVKAQAGEGFQHIGGRKFDIITANILAGPLCKMARHASLALAPEGFIILSGLLNRQAEDVIDSYRCVGTKLVDQIFIEDWTTLILRKKDHG